MKFTCQIDINLPKQKVVELWMNSENNKKWQKGFESVELLEGEKYSPGAVSIVHLLHKGKPMTLRETILENNLPNDILARYEHKHMVNTMRSSFKEENGITIYTADVHYEKFIGFIPKMFAKIFPKMFKSQTQGWLDNFKLFCESDEQ